MSEPELKLNDRLAIDRTRLAAERSLMAWIRTALSMIAFGFTIYKFLQALHELHLDRRGYWLLFVLQAVARANFDDFDLFREAHETSFNAKNAKMQRAQRKSSPFSLRISVLLCALGG